MGAHETLKFMCNLKFGRKVRVQQKTCGTSKGGRFDSFSFAAAFLSNLTASRTFVVNDKIKVKLGSDKQGETNISKLHRRRLIMQDLH